MPIRPDNLETLRLSLELLRRIPSRHPITAEELHGQIQAEGIQRDIRSIQRQLKVLSDSFDIDCDTRSKPYGYKWKGNSGGFSVRSLSEQESLLLILAEQHLQNFLPPSLMKSMSAFFDQARRNLTSPPGVTESRASKLNKEWLDKVRVVSTSQPLIPPKIDHEVFENVSTALYNNQWLAVTFKNQKAAKKTSTVMPLGIAQQGLRMYLVCRFEGYDNERSLAMNRISKAEVSSLTFDRPKHFNFKQYDDDGRFGFGEGKKIRLVFRISRPAGLHLLESPLSIDQFVTEHEDCYEIAATVVDTAQLTWWLLGFGDRVWDITKTPV